MAEDSNTAANGLNWTGILNKGIDVVGDIIGAKYGQQNTPTPQPTTLNPANPGSTGQPAASAPAAQTVGSTTKIIIAVFGGALLIGLGALLFGRRRR
jgi:LPXTG-motif cell wall-anchored protein